MQQQKGGVRLASSLSLVDYALVHPDGKGTPLANTRLSRGSTTTYRLKYDLLTVGSAARQTKIPFFYKTKKIMKAFSTVTFIPRFVGFLQWTLIEIVHTVSQCQTPSISHSLMLCAEYVPWIKVTKHVFPVTQSPTKWLLNFSFTICFVQRKTLSLQYVHNAHFIPLLYM